MYKLTYLGHAGFMLETDSYLFLMDPWLTRQGAYDNSWFQFPCNHHLEDEIVEKVLNTKKPVFLYVSHEHKDHWDPRFISLLDSKPTLLLPRFRRRFLRDQYRDYPGHVKVFNDGETIPLPGDSYVEFYIHDSVREADSALLISHGASWFPTCYEYDEKTKAQRAKKNMYARFTTMAKVIQDMKPDFYIPSAGPVCFLDDQLFDLNFQEDTIFPLPGKFYKYLASCKYETDGTAFVQLHPGQWLDTSSDEDSVSFYPNLRKQLEHYRDSVADILKKRADRSRVDPNKIAELLADNLRAKLNSFSLALAPCILSIYLCEEGVPQTTVRVYFDTHNVYVYSVGQQIGSVPVDGGYRHYEIVTELQDIAPLASGEMTWYEWLLSLRFSIERDPDEFNPLLDGFMVNEAEDLPEFCNHYKNRSSNETLRVADQDGIVYEFCRKCPHEGADLANGYVDHDGNLVCPKHSWKFNLKDRGYCEEHNASINAEVVDE